MGRPQPPSKDHSIWVDILCLPSVIRLIRLRQDLPHCPVRYCNASKWIAPFIPVLRRVLRTSFEEIDWVDYGSRFDDGKCLYETVIERFWTIWREFCEAPLFTRIVGQFADRHGYEFEILKKHFAERAFEIVVRPIEIAEIVRLFGTPDDVLILQATDFTEEIKRFYPDLNIAEYALAISRVWATRRERYYFDRAIFPLYGASLNYKAFGIFLRVLALLPASLIVSANRYFSRRQTALRNGVKAPAILVHYSQSHYASGVPSDLFWWPHADIPSEHIVILMRTGLDPASLKKLRGDGITLATWSNNPIAILKQIWSNSVHGSDYLVIAPSLHAALKSAWGFLVTLFPNIHGTSAWTRLTLAEFDHRTRWHTDVYNRLGVKLVWSMEDSDRDKMTAVQAAGLNGGLRMGSHTSYFSVPIAVNDHAEDVLFAWGEDSASRFLEHYHNAAVYLTGNPFNDDAASFPFSIADLIDNRQNRFIIGYMDQTALMDIPMGPNSHEQIWSVFSELLKTRPNLTILWKPKAPADALNSVRSLYPEIDSWVATSRIIIASTHQFRRLPPTAVGRVSDLVVGLGLSTAAIECALIGIPAVCFNPAGTLGNKFIKNVKNRFIFTENAEFQARISDIMDGKPYDPDGSIDRFLLKVDPYRDGEAAQRTGEIIKLYFQEVSRGTPREQIHGIVKRATAPWAQDNDQETEIA